MDTSLIQTEIQQYIQEELNDGIGFALDINLIEEGLIDSMGVMSLIVFLEKRFEIEIELEEITEENFRTLTLISTLVERSQEDRVE